MAHIKDDAPFPCFKEKVVGFATTVVVQDRELLGVDVGVNIARLHLAQNQFLIAAQGWAGPEIDHQRLVAKLAGSYAQINCSPGWMLGVEGFTRPVVGGLDADADVGVGEHN